MINAILLFGLIILFACLSFFGFILSGVGFITKRKKLGSISLTVCLSSVCLFSLTTIYTSRKAVNRIYATTQTIEKIINPTTADKFTQITGLEWPETAKIISVRDTYFMTEGEYELVFEADHNVLQTWLSKPPPWELNEWQSNSSPLSLHEWSLRLHLDGTGAGGENAWYAAKELCCSGKGLEWHNGNLLVIDLSSNTVWLSIWDY